MTESMLEKAIRIAVEAHKGQVDKAGALYVLHPLRLMLRMDTEDEMIAAVLHDVVEDSSTALDDLKAEGFATTVLDAIDHLTRRADETYDQFIFRVKNNPIAKKVKVADLEDNMDVRRIEDPANKDMERLRKYRRAWGLLGGVGSISVVEYYEKEFNAFEYDHRAGKFFKLSGNKRREIKDSSSIAHIIWNSQKISKERAMELAARD